MKTTEDQPAPAQRMAGEAPVIRTQLQLTAFGNPAEVVQLQTSAVPALGADEVVVAMKRPLSINRTFCWCAAPKGFGCGCRHYGMRQVNTRGRSSAHKTMLLTAIAFNLKKLLKYQPKQVLRLAIALPKPTSKQQLLPFWRKALPPVVAAWQPEAKRPLSAATATVPF